MAVDGMDKVKQNLDNYAKKLKRAHAAALFQEANAIMTESRKQCPVDTGRLRQSAYVGGPQDDGNNVSVPLGYGTEYALPVHERTDVHHNPPTKAKFLEDPLNDAKAGFAARLATRTKRNLENGVGMDAGVGGAAGDGIEGGNE